MVRCSTSVIDIRNRNIRQEEGVRYIKDLECEKAALQTDSTLHCKGKRKLEENCLCQLTSNDFKEISQLLCLLIAARSIDAL